MKKLILFVLLLLLYSTTYTWSRDVIIDGVEHERLKVIEFSAVSSPSASVTNKARMYFDATEGTLRCSQDGGAYTNCVGGGGGGDNMGSVDTFSEIQTIIADETLISEESGGAFDVDITVPTEVYGVGWNASNEVPTKDALYDKIETMAASGGGTQDNGAAVSPASATDDFAVGGTDSTAPFYVDESAETVKTGLKYIIGLGDADEDLEITFNLLAGNQYLRWDQSEARFELSSPLNVIDTGPSSDTYGRAINDSGDGTADGDLRWESDTETHMLFGDASGEWIRFGDSDGSNYTQVDDDGNMTQAGTATATLGDLVTSDVTASGTGSFTTLVENGNAVYSAADFPAIVAENGAEEVIGESLGTACTENQILKANATGGFDCATDSGSGAGTDDIGADELDDGNDTATTNDVVMVDNDDTTQFKYVEVPDCDGVDEFLGYDQTTQTYSCLSPAVQKYEDCKTIEDPVDADDNITLWAWEDASTIENIWCETQGSSTPNIAMVLSDGTNALDSITCDDGGEADDGNIANASFTSRERVEVDFGAPSGTVDWVTICVTRTID